MHVLAWIALIGSLVGLSLMVKARGPSTRRARRIARVAGVASFVASLALIATLAFAQEPLCSILGGRWIPDTDSCQNEWGGNGNNDVSNGGFPFRLETRDG